MSKMPLTRPYEPNLPLRVLYSRFFDRIVVDEAWIREVRRLAEEGTVVYILRNLNFIDFFALDHLTKRFGLPQVRFANDLGLWVLNPMGKGWLNAILPRRGITSADELRDALSDGGSAALFLKRPPGVLDVAAGATGGRGLKEGDELIQTLIDMQRERPDRPILLVPQVFVWTRRPDTRGTHPMDFLFGPREWPSPARTLGQFLANYRHVELKAGEPLGLQQYLSTAEPAADSTHIRRITYAMLRRLERERRTVTGPAEKPPDRIRHELVRSPRLRSTIHRLSQDGESPRELSRRAEAMLRKLQATPDAATISALEVLFHRVFHRIYAGIDVDREGIERLREASKEASLILLPSHKSHIDYLIVSYVFLQEHLQLPVIAAGDNLSFFPLGQVFRRGGAFFIRRSFKGDKLYQSVVDAYVRRLIRDGFPVELFIEGGRSRTGKLLAPKFGLLGMICDAVLTLPSRKVVFVPVSIGYERIVETEAYERELLGAHKAKEDAAGLLKTTRVLRYRYGRISLQFGSSLTLDDIRDDLGLEHGRPLTDDERRAVVVRMGNRVMDEINRVTAVTPGALTALALLSHPRRGLPHEELVERCDRLLRVLREMGARHTPTTATPSGQLRPDAIREAAQMFTTAELIEANAPAEVDQRRGRLAAPEAGPGAIYTIPDTKRVELDTTKNIIVHFFVERGLVATALLAAPGPPMDEAQVRDRVQRLSRLFKLEFRFRADASFDEIFDETVATMKDAGELMTTDGGQLHPGPGRFGWTGHEWLSNYAEFMRNFVEAYRIAARGLGALVRGPLQEKELVKKALTTGQRMFFTGEIERRESVSQPIIQNAFRSFLDQGHLVEKDGKLQLAEESQETVRAVEASIVAFLVREVPT